MKGDRALNNCECEGQGATHYAYKCVLERLSKLENENEKFRSVIAEAMMILKRHRPKKEPSFPNKDPFFYLKIAFSKLEQNEENKNLKSFLAKDAENGEC